VTEQTPTPTEAAQPATEMPLDMQVQTLSARLMVCEQQRNEAMNREVVYVSENAMLRTRNAQLEALVSKLSKAPQVVTPPGRRNRKG